MNVELQYNMEFMGAIHYNDALELNSYEISLQMTTCSMDAKVSNIALERIRAFVHGEMANVVFVNQTNNDTALIMQALGMNVCTLPDEPIDQIVGIMLYCKLNAITEGQLIINRLDISSALGDSVWYQHSEEDALGPFAADGWWHKSSTQKDSLEFEETPDNVVKVQTTGWNEYGLDWPEPEKEKTAKVFQANFRKHEDNATR